jgi:hypothetical protein
MSLRLSFGLGPLRASIPLTGRRRRRRGRGRSRRGTTNYRPILILLYWLTFAWIVEPTRFLWRHRQAIAARMRQFWVFLLRQFRVLAVRIQQRRQQSPPRR